MIAIKRWTHWAIGLAPHLALPLMSFCWLSHSGSLCRVNAHTPDRWVLAWGRSLGAQGPGREEKGFREWLCHDGHITGCFSDDSGSSNTGPVPVFSHIQRKTKQRSVENPGQEKHGNISFLLTQEFGSHLCEVALIFRCKSSAIRFIHVEYWKKNCLLMNPKWNPTNEMGFDFVRCVCHCFLTNTV